MGCDKREQVTVAMKCRRMDGDDKREQRKGRGTGREGKKVRNSERKERGRA